MPVVVGARHAVPLPPRPSASLYPGPTIVRSFKSAVTKRINELRGSPGAGVWQRGYWEHIIRSDRALKRIRGYIAANPARWDLDRENPCRRGEDEFDLWLDSLSEARSIS